MLNTFKRGGVHPDDGKIYAKDKAIETPAVPDQVCLLYTSKDKDSPSDERAKNEESERQEEASSDSGAPQERKGGSDAGKSESEKKPK